MGRQNGRQQLHQTTIEDFDWDLQRLTNTDALIPKPPPDLTKLSGVERRELMLGKLEAVVRSCSLCNLGKQLCVEKNTEFDPHVFSTMNYSKWVVIGQNPGFNECLQGRPFIGDAGLFWDRCLKRFGVSREDFYISNIVKCHSIGNIIPTTDQCMSCAPFLHMELVILKPILVITLGAVAFKYLCPKQPYKTTLGTITSSSEFQVKVFPIYHPSPRNMSDPKRKEKFIKDVKLLCRLMKAYQAR